MADTRNEVDYSETELLAVNSGGERTNGRRVAVYAAVAVLLMLVTMSIARASVPRAPTSAPAVERAVVKNMDFTTLEEDFQVRCKLPTGKTKMIWATPTTTVKHLKEVVQKYESVPERLQILTYKGQPLEDSHTIVSYGIHDGIHNFDDVVQVELKGHHKITHPGGGFDVFLKINGHTYRKSVTDASPFSDLKEFVEVNKMVHPQDHIARDQQRFTLNGKELSGSGSKTLKECGIFKGIMSQANPIFVSVAPR